MAKATYENIIKLCSGVKLYVQEHDFESPWLYDVLWCFRTLASSICSVSWRAALKIACERKRKNACGKTWQNVIPPTYRPPTGIRNMTAGLWFSVGQLRSLAPVFRASLSERLEEVMRTRLGLHGLYPVAITHWTRYLFSVAESVPWKFEISACDVTQLQWMRFLWYPE